MVRTCSLHFLRRLLVRRGAESSAVRADAFGYVGSVRADVFPAKSLHAYLMHCSPLYRPIQQTSSLSPIDRSHDTGYRYRIPDDGRRVVGLLFLFWYVHCSFISCWLAKNLVRQMHVFECMCFVLLVRLVPPFISACMYLIIAFAFLFITHACRDPYSKSSHNEAASAGATQPFKD